MQLHVPSPTFNSRRRWKWVCYCGELTYAAWIVAEVVDCGRGSAGWSGLELEAAAQHVESIRVSFDVVWRKGASSAVPNRSARWRRSVTNDAWMFAVTVSAYARLSTESHDGLKISRTKRVIGARRHRLPQARLGARGAPPRRPPRPPSPCPSHPARRPAPGGVRPHVERPSPEWSCEGRGSWEDPGSCLSGCKGRAFDATWQSSAASMSG